MSSADRMAVDMNIAGAGAVAIDTAVAASVASGIEVLRHILRQYSTNWHLLQLNERWSESKIRRDQPQEIDQLPFRTRVPVELTSELPQCHYESQRSPCEAKLWHATWPVSRRESSKIGR